MTRWNESVYKPKLGKKKGKNFNRRLRASGQIPAVLYGKKSAPLPLTFDPKPLQKELRGKNTAGVFIELEITGDKKEKKVGDA